MSAFLLAGCSKEEEGATLSKTVWKETDELGSSELNFISASTCKRTTISNGSDKPIKTMYYYTYEHPTVILRPVEDDQNLAILKGDVLGSSLILFNAYHNVVIDIYLKQ